MADIIYLDGVYINRDKILFANIVDNNNIRIYVENDIKIDISNTPYNREKLLKN
jgi:hypothetical protein